MGAIVFLSMILVIVTIGIHYEALRGLSRAMEWWHGRPRQRVLLLVFGVFAAHLVEVTVYAVGYWLGEEGLGLGVFAGTRDHTFLDYIYFAAETFTTLGLGDIYPVGKLRLLAGVESLDGLLLIGWSASMTYIAMSKSWSLIGLGARPETRPECD
jgi:hypothetical protein